MNEILLTFFASLEKHTGISLDINKKYLIDSRLSPIAKENGFKEVKDLLLHLNKNSLGGLHYKAFDALTTNETMFFRDPHVFEALRTKILPELIRARSKKKNLRIWSAASSTGQEAYSIAIMLSEMIPDLQDWDIQIVGTDFSERALNKAKEGVYNHFELSRGLDKHFAEKYFGPVRSDGTRQANSKIREIVKFSLINLVDSWPSLPYFDIVFLRNVLIYFTQDTKDKVLNRVSKLMGPADGILILGASEMIPLSTQFKMVQLEKISYYKVVLGEGA